MFLEKGTTIALASVIEGFSYVVNQVSPGNGRGDRKVVTLNDVPEHLSCIMGEASENLTPEQKLELAKILIEYEEVFVGPDGKIGKTNLVEHKIDTGDHVPIKQRARRLPFSQQGAMDKEIDKMLEQGVIRESNSPWSSPVVLVLK